jgi:hypothetical protein
MEQESPIQERFRKVIEPKVTAHPVSLALDGLHTGRRSDPARKGRLGVLVAGALGAVERISVLWERGEHGPEEFYLKLGFIPTGEELFGEVVAFKDLSIGGKASP